jgi:hypothetical protein
MKTLFEYLMKAYDKAVGAAKAGGSNTRCNYDNNYYGDQLCVEVVDKRSRSREARQ